MLSLCQGYICVSSEVVKLSGSLVKEMNQKAISSRCTSLFLCSNPFGHEMWIMTKEVRSCVKQAFPSGHGVLLWRLDEELCPPQASQSRTSAPLHQNESAEVVQASD